MISISASRVGQMQTPPWVIVKCIHGDSVSSTPPQSFGCPVKVDFAARAEKYAVFRRRLLSDQQAVSRGRKNYTPLQNYQGLSDRLLQKIQDNQKSSI